MRQKWTGMAAKENIETNREELVNSDDNSYINDSTEKEIHSKNQNIVQSSIKMALATIASRFTGLLRVWAMAFALGSGVIASSYNIAYNMPSLICDLVVGGIMGAAFLPVYLLAKEQGGKAASGKYGSAVINWFILILGFLSIVCSVFAPEIILTQTFTVSNDSEVYQNAVSFFRVFAFQILFYGIGGILSGILNAERIFGLPSLVPAINNVISAVGFFIYVPIAAVNATLAIWVLAFMVTSAVLIQVIVQVPLLVKNGFVWTPTLKIPKHYIIETLRIALPTLIYIFGMIAAFTFRNAYALNVDENGPAVLSYAWTWFQLPYGVISVSLTTALFTEMGEAHAQHDMETLRSTIYDGIVWTIFLIAPMAVLLSLLSTDIMGTFQAGAFTKDSVFSVAVMLSIWACGLPLYAVLMFFYRVFSAIRKAGSFAVLSTVLVIIECGMYFVLTHIIGLSGIPVADILYYACMVIVLWVFLVHCVGNFVEDKIATAKKLIRILIASATCGLSAFIFNIVYKMIPFFAEGGILPSLIVLLSTGIIGLCAFYFTAKILKIEEIKRVDLLISRIFAMVRKK